MMVMKRTTIFAILVFFALSGFVNAQELMGLEAVEALIESSTDNEVEGYFKTVRRGSRIETLALTLRGVYKEPGLKVIVFVTHHKIAAGMSGSPVYVNGKLIGALAYKLNSPQGNDHNWGGISPISLMEEDLTNSPGFANNAIDSFTYEGMVFEPIATGYQSIPGLEYLLNKFILTGNAAAQIGAAKPVIEPGMPIVVDLVEWTDKNGEVSSISSVGTVTHIDEEGRVFAFGHPFLNGKDVVYSFRTGEIIGTLYQDMSYKLVGKMTEVLGSITRDSTYGIYGRLGVDNLDELHHFSLDFKREGRLFNSFEIRVADSILTPVLAAAAFALIGQSNGAPLPQEKSATQLEARIEIEGHQPIVWRELFASTSSRFGPQTLYLSSYSVANESLFSGLYGSLFVNDFDLKIINVYVSVDFISGSSRTYKVVNYKFPSKITYGQDPTLEIIFADQANSMPVAARIIVPIDWDKVEGPVYGRDVANINKTAEKRVTGSLSVYSATSFYNIAIHLMGDRERQIFAPNYHLGPEDYLANFSRLLEATNQKIIVRISLRARSDLPEESPGEEKELISSELPENDNGWIVIEGGLKNRQISSRAGEPVVSYLELPPIPDGGILDQETNKSFGFEVVLEESEQQ